MTGLVASVLAALAGIGHALPEKHRRLEKRPAPLQPALASWYDDYYGPTASGVRYRYGFASLMFGSRWGTRVQFCYRGRCTVGRLDDHGPYVAGRQFDLNWTLHEALGCPDLCELGWRLAG